MLFAKDEETVQIICNKEIFDIQILGPKMIAAFYQKHVKLYDEFLMNERVVDWSDIAGVPVKQLGPHSISNNWREAGEVGIICCLYLTDEVSKTIPCKSVYAEQLAKLEKKYAWRGGRGWILRLRATADGKSLEPYNTDTESMLFKEEQPRNACEFKKNVFILTSDPLHMYCVYDWETVKLI